MLLCYFLLSILIPKFTPNLSFFSYRLFSTKIITKKYVSVNNSASYLIYYNLRKKILATIVVLERRKINEY